MKTSDKLPTEEALDVFETHLKSIYETIPIHSTSTHGVKGILQNNFTVNPFCLGVGYRAAANDGKDNTGIMIYETTNGDFKLVVQPSAERSKEGMITLVAEGTTRELLENQSVMIVNEENKLVLEGKMVNGKLIGIIQNYLTLHLGEAWRVELKKE